MKILTTSDLHCRRLLYTQLWERVAGFQPDLVLVAGDWLESGDGADLTPYEAGVFFSEMSLHRPVVFSPGNHETYGDGLPEFRRGWKNKAPLVILTLSDFRCSRATIGGTGCGLQLSGCRSGG